MTPSEACKLIVDLFEWDEDGVVAPKPPYSWMTVASIAGDYSKGALADSAQEPEGLARELLIKDATIALLQQKVLDERAAKTKCGVFVAPDEYCDHPYIGCPIHDKHRARATLETKGGCPTCKSPEPHRHPTNDFGEATRSCKDEWHTVNRSRVEQP